MPPRTNGAAGAAPRSRFTLPALDFKFSLTEGTDIPPPLPSPVQEKPARPKTPPPAPAKEVEKKDSNGVAQPNGQVSSPGLQTAAITKAGTKRPADDTPASPAGSNRPSSLRRLFSRNLLNTAYANGETASHGPPSTADSTSMRPASRSNSTVDEKKAKRGSGWFRRLRGADGVSGTTSKRSSVIFEDVKAPAQLGPQTPMGPPAPMIPELKDLEKDEGSLGGDLFKNIK